VNHKRVERIMREDNLLAVQPRQFVVTTKSDHKLEVYLNLARRMKLAGIDQLWEGAETHPFAPSLVAVRFIQLFWNEWRGRRDSNPRPLP
jgi:hypothetical protein